MFRVKVYIGHVQVHVMVKDWGDGSYAPSPLRYNVDGSFIPLASNAIYDLMG